MIEGLEFLQQNAEWMCSIALVLFTFMQWWISRKQLIQTLRFKRLELAQKLDHVAVTFLGDSETSMQFYQFLAENQSNFKFLLKKRSYKYVEELFNFIKKVRNTPSTSMQGALQNLITFNEYLNSLTDVLCNAEYGMVKYKSENESLKPYKEIVENMGKMMVSKKGLELGDLKDEKYRT